ncbi:MAG: hypothetical protein QNJ67_02165 [Kiloniellales bacterium]|nr:hypothetical protein [Kiloniellales bacterium]
MFSRGIATGASIALSLGLILLVVFGLVAQPEEPPRSLPEQLPAAEAVPDTPPPEERPPASARAVVLPPPPPPQAARPAAEAPAIEPQKPAPPVEAKAAPKPPPAPKPAPRAAEAKPPPVAKKPVARPRETRKPVPLAEPRKAPAPSPRLAARAEPRPVAKPMPRRPIAEVRRPPKAVKREPAPRKETAAKQTITASREDVAEGRTLLRLLEYGSGPSIELAWPDRANQRETLYSTLDRCFGMQVALMDGQGRLFISEGRPNTPWALNLDRFSGFIREPAGRVSGQERRAIDRIRAHHRGVAVAQPVRIFPRSVDARLLGGLQRLLGDRYGKARTIRARYRMDGRRLIVDRVVADGRNVPGRLELPPLGGCRSLAKT